MTARELITPPAERPLRADARRNRARILEAARAAFAELGPEAQMDDVARRAEVGVGTVYRHFPTKEALLLALMREKFAHFAEVAERALADDGDAFDALAGMLEANAEYCSRDIALQQTVAGPSEAWEYAKPEIERLNAAAAELVRRGHRAGTVSEAIRAEDLPMLMCGVASSMSHPNPGFDWRRHLELVISLLRPSRS